MANLSFRAATNGVDNSFLSATISATLPTGTVQNDLGVIFYHSHNIAPTAAPTHTTPTGWTARGTATYSGGGLNSRVTCYSRVEGATPGAETLTSSGTPAHMYHRLSYDNPNTAGEFDVIGAFVAIIASTLYTATGVTTTQDNVMVLHHGSQNAAAITFTPDADFTSRVAAQSAFTDEHLYPAGATGDQTATASAATADGITLLVGFRSEAAAGHLMGSLAGLGGLAGAGGLAGRGGGLAG